MTAARLVHLGKAASAAAALFALTNPAEAGGTLRVAMTASTRRPPFVRLPGAGRDPWCGRSGVFKQWQYLTNVNAPAK